MAEFADIIQGVTTVGFPIIAYLLVYLDLRKKLEKLTEAIIKLNARLDVED